jgi:hypothetical protein
MSKVDDGGQVYPLHIPAQYLLDGQKIESAEADYGITRLDWLAGEYAGRFAVMLATHNWNELRGFVGRLPDSQFDSTWNATIMGYDLAEAVIAEGRRREQKEVEDGTRSK